ncbi:MAG: type II toxin-antitoxin system HicB family antitoxin [Thermodesulfobacteriota bacterium]
MKPVYPAKFEKDRDGGDFVQFIDISEGTTDGETREEAELNAREALSGILDYRLDSGAEIPDPSPVTGPDIIGFAPDAQAQAALLIRKQRGSKPLSDLARAFDTSWPAVQRLEDRTTGRHSSSSTGPPPSWASAWSSVSSKMLFNRYRPPA